MLNVSFKNADFSLKYELHSKSLWRHNKKNIGTKMPLQVDDLFLCEVVGHHHKLPELLYRGMNSPIELQGLYSILPKDIPQFGVLMMVWERYCLTRHSKMSHGCLVGIRFSDCYCHGIWFASFFLILTNLFSDPCATGGIKASACMMLPHSFL